MSQAINCTTMQTPFVLNIAGQEYSVNHVSTHKASTMSYGEIDKVVFHVVGNQWLQAIELTGTSLVNAYRSE